MSTLKDLTVQYLYDVNPLNQILKSPTTMLARGKQIGIEYNEIIGGIGDLSDSVEIMQISIQDLQSNPPGSSNGNVDGGGADGIYLTTQKIDGGDIDV